MDENIGKVIRELRKQSGMSQSKLADKIGVTYQQVQKYEKGKTKLNIARLEQIADVFDMPVKHLLAECGIDISESYDAFSEDETHLLTLFRKVKRKKHRLDVLNILDHLTSFTEE